MSAPEWIRERRPAPRKPLPWVGNEEATAREEPPVAAEEAPPAADPAQARIAELERMLEQARARSEELEREAFEKAFRAGEQAGMEVGRKRAEQMLAGLEKELGALAAEAERVRAVLAEAGWQVLETALARALGEAFADPERLRALVARALEDWPVRGEVELVVPAAMREAAQALAADHPLLARMRVDPAMEAPAIRLAAAQGDLWLDPAEATRRFVQRLRDGADALARGG